MSKSNASVHRISIVHAVSQGIRVFFRFITRMLGRVLGMVLCFVLAFILVRAYVPNLLMDVFGFTRAQELTETVIREELTAISEFATYEFTYVNHVDCVNQPKLLGHAVLLTDHWFAFDYQGVIKAGFDVEDIDLLWIDSVACTVGIRLPRVEILSNDISMDMSTYEDRNNLCNPLAPREVLDYLYAQREPELEKALSLGLLEKARENAEQVITVLIESQGYSVTFVR